MHRVSIITLLSLFISSLSLGQGTPVPANVYGPGVAFNLGLANLEVGKFTPARSVDYRFRARATDTITSIVWFSKHGAGYSSGTGGSMLFQIQTDDGTANHFASGTTLGSTTDPSPINTVLTSETFSPPVAVITGTIYHLVFSNTDANPQANYVSVDDTTSFSGQCNPLQYNSFDTDLAVLDNESAPWLLKCAHYPILGINYSGGSSQGSGYVDALVSSGLFTMNGTNKVRETFTISGGDKKVIEAWVNVQQLGTPTAGLTVRLETAGGTQIEQLIIPSGQITTNGITNGTGAWSKVTFAGTDTLTNGVSYNIVFSDPTDSGVNGYVTYPIQDGGPTFPTGSFYNNGFYQNTIDGTTWTNFNASTHFHLTWFLRTQAQTPVMVGSGSSGPTTASWGGNIFSVDPSTNCVPGACVSIHIPVNSRTLTAGITGTFSASLAAEQSIDGGFNWTSTGITASTPGTLIFGVQNVTDFRMRALTYTSGNIGVNFNASPAY